MSFSGLRKRRKIFTTKSEMQTEVFAFTFQAYYLIRKVYTLIITCKAMAEDKDRLLVELLSICLEFIIVFLFVIAAAVLGYLWVSRENEKKAKKDGKAVKKPCDKNLPGVVALDQNCIVIRKNTAIGREDIGRRRFRVGWQPAPEAEHHHSGATVEKPAVDDTSALVSINCHSRKLDARNHRLPNGLKSVSREIQPNEDAHTEKCGTTSQAAALPLDSNKKPFTTSSETTERSEATPIKSEDDDISTFGQEASQHGSHEPDYKAEDRNEEDTQSDRGYFSDDELNTPVDRQPNVKEERKSEAEIIEKAGVWTDDSGADSADNDSDGEYTTEDRTAPTANDAQNSMALDCEEETRFKELFVAATPKTRKKKLPKPNFNRVIRDTAPLKRHEIQIGPKIDEDDMYGFIMRHCKQSGTDIIPAAVNCDVYSIPFEVCGVCKDNFHRGICVKCGIALCDECAAQHYCRPELRKAF